MSTFYCTICWLSIGDDDEGEGSRSGSLPSAKKAKLEVSKKDACCTPCGHIFHTSCLQAWFNAKSTIKGRDAQRGTCPKCRRPVIKTKLYPVYPDFDEDLQGDNDNNDTDANESESEGSESEITYDSTSDEEAE